MLIRKVEKGDKNQLIHLLEVFNSDTKKFVPEVLLPFEEYEDSKKTFEETAKSYIEQQKYILFVAEENDELLGFVCGEVLEKKYRKFHNLGYIHDWFVLSKARKKHIGQQLFDEMVNEFKKRNCEYISLDAFINNLPAIAIYHKLGFTDRLLGLVKRI